MAARKLPKVLSRDELARLLAMPNVDCPTGLRDRALLELLYGAGLRVSEACGVTLRDIDWREAVVRVRHAKGGRERVVPLDTVTMGFLERWKAERRRHAKREHPQLFVTVRAPAGRPLSRHRVWEMLDRRSRKAGIRHASPHMLRHSLATHMLSEDYTIREVQEMLGHERVTTTQIYTAVNPVELAAKVRGRR